MARAKTLTLRLSAILAAYDRAESLSATWRAADPRWGQDTWQAAALETLMLPGVWQHLQARGRAAAGDWAGRAYDYYAPLTRGTIDSTSRPTGTGKCNGVCLNGKRSCDCKCRGRCHGAGKCYCGTAQLCATVNYRERGTPHMISPRRQAAITPMWQMPLERMLGTTQITVAVQHIGLARIDVQPPDKPRTVAINLFGTDDIQRLIDALQAAKQRMEQEQALLASITRTTPLNRHGNPITEAIA